MLNMLTIGRLILRQKVGLELSVPGFVRSEILIRYKEHWRAAIAAHVSTGQQLIVVFQSLIVWTACHLHAWIYVSNGTLLQPHSCCLCLRPSWTAIVCNWLLTSSCFRGVCLWFAQIWVSLAICALCEIRLPYEFLQTYHNSKLASIHL